MLKIHNHQAKVPLISPLRTNIINSNKEFLSKPELVDVGYRLDVVLGAVLNHACWTNHLVIGLLGQTHVKLMGCVYRMSYGHTKITCRPVGPSYLLFIYYCLKEIKQQKIGVDVTVTGPSRWTSIQAMLESAKF